MEAIPHKSQAPPSMGGAGGVQGHWTLARNSRKRLFTKCNFGHFSFSKSEDEGPQDGDHAGSSETPRQNKSHTANSQPPAALLGMNCQRPGGLLCKTSGKCGTPDT